MKVEVKISGSEVNNLKAENVQRKLERLLDRLLDTSKKDCDCRCREKVHPLTFWNDRFWK